MQAALPRLARRTAWAYILLVVAGIGCAGPVQTGFESPDPSSATAQISQTQATPEAARTAQPASTAPTPLRTPTPRTGPSTATPERQATPTPIAPGSVTANPSTQELPSASPTHQAAAGATPPPTPVAAAPPTPVSAATPTLVAPGTLEATPYVVPTHRTSPSPTSQPAWRPVAPAPVPACTSATPLSVSPVDPGLLESITPLGNLNPSSHTFPTSHTYMHVRRSLTGSPAQADVRAPSDGKIVMLNEQHSSGPRGIMTDYSMEILVCGGIHLVFIHLGSITERLATAIAGATTRCNEYETGGTQYRHCPYFGLQLQVKAGEVLGKTGVSGGAFDFGAYDLAGPSRPGFVNPELYHAEARYNLCPYELYPGPVRAAFTQLIRNTYASPPAEPGCGKVDHDIPGTASGNWFGSLSPPSPEDENIALVHNVAREVSQPVFSIGRSLPGVETGVYPFSVRAEGAVNRDFKDVVPGNVYCYENLRVFNRQGNADGKVILVRLESERALAVEVLQRRECGAGPWTITPGAVRYAR